MHRSQWKSWAGTGKSEKDYSIRRIRSERRWGWCQKLRCRKPGKSPKGTTKQAETAKTRKTEAAVGRWWGLSISYSSHSKIKLALSQYPSVLYMKATRFQLY